MKIVVLAGGYSPEREVSLTSGSLIANALMQNGHRVLLLDVYEGIRELPDDVDRLFLEGGCYTHSVSEEVPDLEALRARCQNGDALIGANVLRLCAMADKVFLALHGSMGENGQLQATSCHTGSPPSALVRRSSVPPPQNRPILPPRSRQTQAPPRCPPWKRPRWSRNRRA